MKKILELLEEIAEQEQANGSGFLADRIDSLSRDIEQKTITDAKDIGAKIFDLYNEYIEMNYERKRD